MEALECIKTRRSVRRFTEEPVTPEQVAEAEGSFTGQYLKPLLEKDKLLRQQEAEAAQNAPAAKKSKKKERTPEDFTKI